MLDHTDHTDACLLLCATCGRVNLFFLTAKSVHFETEYISLFSVNFDFLTSQHDYLKSDHSIQKHPTQAPLESNSTVSITLIILVWPNL